jgi:hypothetical protein
VAAASAKKKGFLSSLSDKAGAFFGNVIIARPSHYDHID